jgi:hypothetical protein
VVEFIFVQRFAAGAVHTWKLLAFIDVHVARDASETRGAALRNVYSLGTVFMVAERARELLERA